ncbi:hypothetical protein AB0467_30610 [Streptomyces sp. NPDC052095]|uniref:hypothetical protein n=1 Tax=Streptomyces sp. NPDC052095 TaxID=3155678 RepID=UPI003450CF45
MVAVLGGLRMALDGGGPGAPDRLAGIRITVTAAGAPDAGVVRGGVDLFGHPSDEVLAVLPEPVRSPGARGWAAVPGLSLRLGGEHVPAGEPWRGLVLTGDGHGGREPCCRGRFGCPNGGNGLVGLML